jgi:hypothetical protein
VAEAAGSQRMFWQMHSTLLAAEAPLTNGVLAAAAAAVGLDVPSFQEDVRRHIHLPRIREDFMTGVRSWRLVKDLALLGRLGQQRGI